MKCKCKPLGDAEGVKIRKGRNKDVEFHVESKRGMRYPRAVYKPTGQTITALPHGLSVSNAAEWVCLVDNALASIDINDRDAAYRAVMTVQECFSRRESCPAELRKRCIKKW